MVLKLLRKADLIYYASSSLLAFLLLLSSILIRELYEIRTQVSRLCTSLLLFNFQGSVLPRFLGTAFVVYHKTQQIVKSFFEIFFIF